MLVPNWQQVLSAQPLPNSDDGPPTINANKLEHESRRIYSTSPSFVDLVGVAPYVPAFWVLWYSAGIRTGLGLIQFGDFQRGSFAQMHVMSLYGFWFPPVKKAESCAVCPGSPATVLPTLSTVLASGLPLS